MEFLKKLSVLIIIGAFSFSATAQPAPWYKWQSKVNGRVFCKQTSPGEGWTKISGPYKDARCTKPASPVTAQPML